MTTDTIYSNAAEVSAAMGAKTIWKFPISLTGYMSHVPSGARLLSVGAQGEEFIGLGARGPGCRARHAARSHLCDRPPGAARARQ